VGNRLDGGAGTDVLVGRGGADAFVFSAGYDADRIADYTDEVDRIDLRDFDFGSFAEVKSLATNTPAGDLSLNFGDGDVLLITGFSRASFDAGDVIL